MIMAAREDGSGHGGVRPRLDQLRRVAGIPAQFAYPTSFSIPNYTYSMEEIG
jgi:hypothetical protein